MTSSRQILALSPMFLSACSLAPHYTPPFVATPVQFKQASGWQPAQPADDVARGAWWRLFDDAALNSLESQVVISNQNVAAAAAAFAEARATAREAKVAVFPVVSGLASGTKEGSFGSQSPILLGAQGSGVSQSDVGSQINDLLASKDERFAIGASVNWEADLWGRIRSGANQSKAEAQASAADLANATLAVQAELATDYVELRSVDEQRRVLDDTVAVYAHALTITQNREHEGVAAPLDVFQAEAQLRDAKAQAVDLERQRAAYEDAIAVLVGANPSNFSVARAPWMPVVPAVPSILPASLLQRRPDVASAERKAAAANANIGIQKAAFFPVVTLSGSIGGESSNIGSLLTASSSLWSLGGQVAETLIDFGARKAKLREARAAYDQAIAQYRQTVLSAFQQTEDALAAIHVLAVVGTERAAGSDASTKAMELAFNQYLAGQTEYAQVVTIQTTALSARQARIGVTTDQQTAAISLIKAIGGSW